MVPGRRQRTKGGQSSKKIMTDLEEKEQRLAESLTQVPTLIVAYSGGVDSAYLAYAAHRVLGGQFARCLVRSKTDGNGGPQTELVQ